MKWIYEITGEGIRIWRCFSYGTQIEIPEEIEGFPVTELAPYCFSGHQNEQELERKLEEGSLVIRGEGDDPVLQGNRLTGVYLPARLCKIGAYAFYNCNALEELHFYGSLSDLGAGLFTGCHHIRRLEVTLEEEETSCLQEILMEVPEQLSVILHGKEEAQLVFPEFFEEGVENTPARILVTHTHGSGMNYRNCFYQRRFEFQAYDRCFFRAKAQENPDTVLDMVLGRLLYPRELSESGRKDYECWVREHMETIGMLAVQRKDGKLLQWLTEGYVLQAPESRRLLKLLTDEAGALGFTEGAGYLLDMLHRNFLPERKTFAL